MRLEVLDEVAQLDVRLELVNKFLQQNAVSEELSGAVAMLRAPTLAVASSLVRCRMTLNILYLTMTRQRSGQAAQRKHTHAGKAGQQRAACGH